MAQDTHGHCHACTVGQRTAINPDVASLAIFRRQLATVIAAFAPVPLLISSAPLHRIAPQLRIFSHIALCLTRFHRRHESHARYRGAIRHTRERIDHLHARRDTSRARHLVLRHRLHLLLLGSALRDRVNVRRAHVKVNAPRNRVHPVMTHRSESYVHTQIIYIHTYTAIRTRCRERALWALARPDWRHRERARHRESLYHILFARDIKSRRTFLLEVNHRPHE